MPMHDTHVPGSATRVLASRYMRCTRNHVAREASGTSPTFEWLDKFSCTKKVEIKANL